jgi:hypothetical protein
MVGKGLAVSAGAKVDSTVDTGATVGPGLQLEKRMLNPRRAITMASCFLFIYSPEKKY